MKSLQVITLGCSKNTVDTEHLLFQIRDSFEIVPEGEERPVDYLLINTCGFIGDAKQQSIDTILSQVGRKNSGEIGKIFVFGCLSQRYMSEMPSLIPEVDSWFGARDLDPLIRALGCTPDHSSDHKRILTDRTHPYAYLKISEGCDRRCSYCAIPFIRGAHRSVPIETLVKEAEDLAEKGIKELVLIAQDTTFYGLDLYHKRCLAELLRRLSDVDGIEWIRIHYSYPADFPEDVLDEMALNPKVCRYMDIPLQHISDKVLDNMHRHVDGAWTRALIGKMRSRVPGLVLRTTMIVGHPGEGKKEFEELLDFVREARFERLGAFMYSEEEGTYGAEHFRDS
ncbi:MAG: 30S ribosomal protein S12 methylthiotransferase RimO, partial [Bacteroidales bacterium]|nr:30S ribosomal protein S12 methylthiotransferase RimO [Bacteroidales bacterium]